jgi:hypothetical protein
MIEESSLKIYVNVNVEFTKDGKLIPRTIHWADGTIYEIDRITDVRRAANIRVGGSGIRYTIYVDGFETHLYYGDDHRWFVEANVSEGARIS